MVLPAYQHFRPSIWRQDQYPCALDGRATLHSMAFAFATPVGMRAAIQAAKKTSRICVFIEHPLRFNWMWTEASLLNLVTNGRKFGHIPGERRRFGLR
jgi:hypothetical protein